MSPRASTNNSATPSSSSARVASAPYSRRSTAQPKSTRQQFSACGACRMRRVRCDLKDLAIPTSGPHPTCSNCKERGIKCVDEFADVKAVKLLRRGRRLQQVEAIYGKSTDPDNSGLTHSTRFANAIPALHPDFFCSQFWRWFCIQRPILDAAEFSSRFQAHQKGERTLGPEGGIITMLLVTWAFSHGLSERGLPIDEAEPSSPTGSHEEFVNSHQPQTGKFDHSSPKNREKLEQMVQQVLDLVDYHGIMRRPTLDGVRVLLLLLPLLEDAKPFERLAIHDNAMSQIQALCTLAPATASSSRLSPIPDDAVTRARLFWYAYTQEGLSVGLRGGRFNLQADDYEAFQRTIPHPIYHHGLPSPPSPTSMGAGPSLTALPQESQAYNRLLNSSTLPLQINAACRRIHSVLTGPKAVRRAEEHNLIDAHGMREIWRDLDQCWRELSTIRRNAVNNEDPASRCDTERYACAWQIFIFECHNVIRESLKQYMSAAAQSPYSSSRPSSHSSGSPYLPPDHLHLVATRKCLSLLPRVISIMQFCLTGAGYSDRSGIFTWDSGLVRDGCFYAGYLAASTDEDMLESGHGEPASERDDRDMSSSPLTADEGVVMCLAVLSSKRWLFSKSDEREETIRMIWEARKAKRHGQPTRYADMTYDATYPHANTRPSSRMQNVYQPSNQGLLTTPAPYLDRSALPTLNVFTYQRRSESAPNTAVATDGAHGWPSYTPPGTSTSLTTSNGTGLGSIRGSPEFSNILPGYKSPTEDNYYQNGPDLDHFTYNVPISASHSSTIPAGITNFSHRDSSTVDGLPNGTDVSNYTITSGQSHFTSPGPMLQVAGNDYGSCSQFGENCNGTYH